MSLTYQKNSRGIHQKNQNLEKKSRMINQNSWIGAEFDTNASQVSHQPDKRSKVIEKQFRTQPRSPNQTKTIQNYESNVSRGVGVGHKSPAEFMTDILRLVQERQKSSYVSRQSQQIVTEVLTNKFKLNNYVKRLQSEMVNLDSDVVRNYEVLIILLQQLSSAQVQVRHGNQGMEVKFNRGVIHKQQSQIEKLQRDLEERDKQIKYITEQYESIIFNFNDVIQKLVSKDEARNKSKH